MSVPRLFSLLLVLALGVRGVRADTADTAKLSPRQLVQTAFDRMFNYPSVRSIELHIYRGARLVSYRSFDVAYDRLEGRGHTVLRFTGPEYLRGNALLVVERDGGHSDSWLYQPEEQRLRRVGTQQKGDPFYGSDLSFEDLEHHAWERFRTRGLPDADLDGVVAFVVEALPPEDSHYGRLRIYIEKERLAVSRVDFFRRGSGELLKQMLIPAGRIEEIHGWLVPREISISQNGRDARTVVEITRVEVDPGLTAKAFSVLRLQRSGEDLFDLLDRGLEQQPR